MRSSSLFRPALLVALGALLASCEHHSDDNGQPVPTGNGSHVYITNEGTFGSANGSVSLLDKTTNATTANLFQTVNGRPLGDVVQSMAVVGNTGYIVVNNSNKVEAVSLPSFKSVATIGAVVQPRYLVAAGAKGFVTEWLSSTAGRVSVIDLSSNSVTSTLPAGRGPEKPLLYQNTLYVPNSDENTLTLIDAARQQVTGTLPVSDGPRAAVADKNGAIWVLCSGITRYGAAPNYPVLSSTPGALVRFMPGTPTQQLVLPFAAGAFPGGLRISPDGSQLYYQAAGNEYRMSITASTLPTTPFIRRNFYGFDIDPADGTLYGCLASFSGNSKVIRYRPDGTAIDSTTSNLGIGANGAAFY